MVIDEIRLDAGDCIDKIQVRIVITGIRRWRFRLRVAGWLIALAQRVSGNKFELVDARPAP